MDLIDDEREGSNTPEFTVSEIASTVRRLVETELGWVRVRGEVGRVVRARSGHLYFDLKDDKNVLSCMTWKGQVPGIGVMPEEGMEVVAQGKMTASGFQSKFALNVQSVAVAGEGALMAMLERRKKALAAEGLFAEERKKPLPFLPEIIGVVTSSEGAVIRDILHRLRDRFPRKVLIWPVAVQGERCAPEVARAIEGFNALTPGGALPRPDLLIVARGGGSIEDLWGFNEEIVARAAAASAIPLISAVGHETDTTLIDYASDRRAPTPTAAAEMAVPVRSELAAWLREQDARLARALHQGVSRRQEKLRDLSRLLPSPMALLQGPVERLDRTGERLERGVDLLVERKRARFEQLAAGIRPAALVQRFAERRQALFSSGDRLGPALARFVRDKRRDLDREEAQLHRAFKARVRGFAERQAQQRTDLGLKGGRLRSAMESRLAGLQERLAGLERVRQSVGYQATLARGYAVVRAGDRVVTGVEAARAAGAVEIEFVDGRTAAQVAGGPANSAGPAKKTKAEDQGSLF